MGKSLKIIRHIMHYGRMRLPLAKRIRRERIIDVEYNRFFMLWDVLPDRSDKLLRKQLYIRSRSTSAISRAGANIDVYAAGEDAGGRKNADKHENRQIQAIPSNLPQPPKRPETPRPQLYDAPNLPKIKTSDPPERMPVFLEIDEETNHIRYIIK